MLSKEEIRESFRVQAEIEALRAIEDLSDRGYRFAASKEAKPNRSDYLSRTEVCKAINRKKSTLSSWVTDGKFPSPDTTIERSPMWLHSTVDEWLEARNEQ